MVRTITQPGTKSSKRFQCHPRATRAGVVCLEAAGSFTYSASRTLCSRFSGLKRGIVLRKSDPPKVVSVPYCQYGLSQRAERHETDTQFLQGRKQFLFRIPVPHGIFTLYGRQRTNGMRTLYCGRSGFRKTPMQHLSLLNKSGKRISHFLNRRIRINPVLVKQTDMIRM